MAFLWLEPHMSSVENRRVRETQMGAPRIPPTLFDGGAVGLRIVAAMIDPGPPVKATLKSDPIPIRPRVGPAPKAEEEEEDVVVALSESYTCVIAREGGGTVRRTVYYGGGIGGKFEMNSGVFSEPPAAAGPIAGDFLSCCYLCRRKLHGLDIFMYRGEKAFCSVECRCQHITSDERKEKRRSKAGGPRGSPLPSSSYLSPLPYDAGVAAA